MINLNELCNFLVKAKKSTYAAGDTAEKIINNDKSTTMIFEDGNWKYHDNYFGGEPYGGREVVFFENMPIYMMVYYGWVIKGADFNAVYEVLQEALSLIPKDKPFRGPKKYEYNNMKYNNIFEGEVDNFFGEETIISKDKKAIYKAKYIGGLIDQGK